MSVTKRIMKLEKEIEELKKPIAANYQNIKRMTDILEAVGNQVARSAMNIEELMKDRKEKKIIC